jgi:hypothetical protein
MAWATGQQTMFRSGEQFPTEWSLCGTGETGAKWQDVQPEDHRQSGRGPGSSNDELLHPAARPAFGPPRNLQGITH